MGEYDLIVIGSGPGGEGAAMMAAKNQWRVAVVEKLSDVGGGCTHWGTIPSKALRHAVKTIADFRVNPLTRAMAGRIQPTFPALLATADRVIAEQTAQRRRFYERNGVELIHGTARFAGPGTIAVDGVDGGMREIKARFVLIATGSRPYHPPEVGFTHPWVFDSDTILRCYTAFRTITIYGAGVIGSEYASIFANLGIKVNLINTQDRLLSFMDDEITDALSYHLRDQGVTIRHNEAFERLEARDDGIVLHLKSGRRVKSQALLWANGRTGNTDGLGLATVELAANSRGQLTVDRNYRTTTAGIYAVGDVIGPPALASAAYDQGRFAAEHMLGTGSGHLDESLMPSGIYTIPEISSVGRSERQLQEAGAAYEVGHAWFKHLARGQMTDNRVGMLKLIFDADTRQVLGVHCFGDNASEIVHIGQTVMANPTINTIDYFVNTTFNYPTMAEAYRVAAYNGINRLV